MPGQHPSRRRQLSPLLTSEVSRLASFPRLTVLESILWDLNHVLSIFCGGNLPRVLKTEIRGSRGRGIDKARSRRLRRLMRFPPRLSHFGKADTFWFHLSLRQLSRPTYSRSRVSGRTREPLARNHRDPLLLSLPADCRTNRQLRNCACGWRSLAERNGDRPLLSCAQRRPHYNRSRRRGDPAREWCQPPTRT